MPYGVLMHYGLNALGAAGLKSCFW